MFLTTENRLLPTLPIGCGLSASGSIMNIARVALELSEGLRPIVPASAVWTSATGSLLKVPPSTLVRV
jgi:hypothetical protein